jgi:hypothetical protein
MAGQNTGYRDPQKCPTTQHKYSPDENPSSHVIRMSDNRIPKQLLYGELCQGKRSVRGQKKRYKDTVKASLKCLDIELNSWETLAIDRVTWRKMLYTVVPTQQKQSARQELKPIELPGKPEPLHHLMKEQPAPAPSVGKPSEPGLV